MTAAFTTNLKAMSLLALLVSTLLIYGAISFAVIQRRRTIGVRIPDHPVPRLLLAELGEPLMSSTLLLPTEELPLTAAREIAARLGRDIDAVLDGGDCGIEPTTVVDLSVTPPLLVRKGKGVLGPIVGRAL